MSDRIAVMRAGHIEQLGDPSQLYERPGTVFVAGFLGVSNLLEATVAGREGDLALIDLGSGARLRAPADGLAQGAAVQVGVRPEKLHLSHLASGSGSTAAGDVNILEGDVIDASYVGVSTQYVVRTDKGNEVVVYSQNIEVSGVRDQLSVGERVRLSWKPQHTFVIPVAEHGKEAGGGSPDA